MRFWAVFSGVVLSMTVAVCPVVSVVMAQVPATSSSNTTSAVDTQMTNLRDAYRQQLETYRNDERQYTIDKAQYFQLQTLASLEQAVRSTRTAMMSRAEVLKSYLSILKLELLETKGLDLTLKGHEISNIDQLVGDLEAHELDVEAASDKPKIAAVAKEFDGLSSRVQGVSYESLTFIAYGNMQDVYNQTVSMKNQVQQHVQANETDALKLAEKQRGLDETQRNLDDTGKELDTIKAEILQPNHTFSDASYGQTVENLGSVYAGTSRTVAYLKELITQ